MIFIRAGAVFPIILASSITALIYALVWVNNFLFVTRARALSPSICLIFQISTLACIRTFVLET